MGLLVTILAAKDFFIKYFMIYLLFLYVEWSISSRFLWDVYGVNSFPCSFDLKIWDIA